MGPRRNGGAVPRRRDAVARPRAARPRALQNVAVVGILVGLLAGTFASGSNAAPNRVPGCPGVKPRPAEPFQAQWYSIAVPAFPAGPDGMSDYAVDPLAPNRLYATNGQVVMRSEDSGCTWAESYRLPALGPGPTAGSARILEIEAGAPGVAYLPIQQLEPAPRPHVMVTLDGGATWSEGQGPILNAVTGLIRDLDASHGNRLAASMLLDVHASEPGALTIEAGQVLAATDTGGQTWEPRDYINSPTRVITPNGGLNLDSGTPVYDAITVNPLAPNIVWLFGDEGTAVFSGARTDVGLGPISDLDVSLDGRAVLAFAPGGTAGYLSMDGGESFSDLAVNVPVDSVDTSLGIPSLGAIGGLGRVYYQVILPGQQPRILDISPADGTAISDLQIGIVQSGRLPSVFGRTSTTIEVTHELIGPPVDVTVPVPVGPLVQPDIAASNRLVPQSTRLVLDRGKARTIPYELNLPAGNTPLDVYFLIDISGSMQGAIDGIRGAMQEIVDRLSSLKIDVRFGVGSYRAYTDPPAYSRDRDIGPADQELATALAGLRAAGGGNETQMAALLQSVTGEGDDVIPEGLNMHFRPGSLRVAIQVTDEPISEGGQHPPYPEVIDALVEHDVKQVALAIQEPALLGDHDYEDPGPPADILQKVAEGSRAVVPNEAAVDCDGDGDAELLPDDPIVCMVSSSRSSDASLMADAIVSVLQAVEDIRDLEATVTSAADPAVTPRALDAIAPSVFPEVDLKEPTNEEFAVTVRCPFVAKRTVFPMRVSVARPGVVLATASLTVVCKGPPAENVPVFASFVPVAIVPPPPPRPPDPIPEPNPNPQPNPQQNPQAQAGFAAQEQQQPQVALAHQAAPKPVVEGEAAFDEFQMRSHDDSSRIPPVGFIFAAGGITAGFAYAMATRQRTRTAPAGRGRRYG